MADAFFSIPVTFDLHPVLVQSAAAKTVREFFAIAILNGFIGHLPTPYSNLRISILHNLPPSIFPNDHE
jgi:hypothetical protein